MRGAPEDTICAIATSAGEGGIGIVRISGSDALRISSRVVRLRSRQSLSSVASHTLHLADLLLPSSLDSPGNSNGSHLLDEAFVVHMKAPRSFTGEDVVEIQSHGGSLILSLLCQVCIEAGARLAEPGEFTKRAFLNGRLDLSQAEAVLDTIRAKSAAGLVAAQRQLRGELRREVEGARSALLGLLAQVEAGIDFVEEDIIFLKQEELTRTIEDVVRIIRRLETSFQEGRLLREGARVVILGCPNVGKSSLLNRLLKEERAIVTSVPGTTRDVIEESIDLDGLHIHLVDTAGLRETEDLVEQEGIKRSRSAEQEADLRLIVVDGSQLLTRDDQELIGKVIGLPHVVAVNKADLPSVITTEDMPVGAIVCFLSAKSGMGIDRLKAEIRGQLISPGADAAEGVVVSNVRHRMALQRASEALQLALQSVAQNVAGELLAIDVRAAAEALGEITGAITTDEILNRVFAEFCIGK
jgi:tRNA modification GTPase